MIIHICYISGQSEWWRLHERMLCPVERLPQACTRTALSRPFRHRFVPVKAPPTIPCLCQWARRLSRVKLAVICGVRSAIRRRPFSNCARCCQRIHCCVRKCNNIFKIDVHDKTIFIFTAFQTRRDSRDDCFWPAREEEDSRASHKRRQTSWNLRGGKSVRAGLPLGDVGGWHGDRGGLTVRQAHHRAPAWLQSDASDSSNSRVSLDVAERVLIWLKLCPRSSKPCTWAQAAKVTK